VRFSRTIDDRLHALVPKDASYGRSIANVSVDKGISCVPGQIGKIVQIAGIAQRIDIHDFVLTAREQSMHEVGANEPSTARD
jgi:hypothetical protein